MNKKITLLHDQIVIEDFKTNITITYNKSNIRFSKDNDLLRYTDIIFKTDTIICEYYNLVDNDDIIFATVDLAYEYLVSLLTPSSTTTPSVEDYVTLDDTGKIPLAQLPLILSSNKGFYLTELALTTAYPTATGGDHAIVGGIIDKIYIWDVESSVWIASGGTSTSAVISVNGETGAVIIPTVTTGVDGLMLATDKVKLDNVATNANAYVHPTGDGNSHIPATSTINNNKVLKSGATNDSSYWDNVAYSELSGKPTTISGFGITDVYTKTEMGDITTDLVAIFEASLT